MIMDPKTRHTHYLADSFLDFAKRPFYLGGMILTYLLYFITFMGIFYVNPAYLRNLSTFIQVFICAFLIIRFNPFRQAELRPFDDVIIFACAIFLLANLGITEYVLADVEKIVDHIHITKYINL